MIAASSTTAWCVYGVVDAGTAPPGCETLVEGELAAVVGRIPLSEVGEQAIAEHLNDRVWLEATVRAHEAALQTVLAATSVVPFRFGAIYQDLDDVHAMLRERSAALREQLHRVRGRVEIGAKAWAADAPAGDADSPPPTGRAYLERKATARTAAEARSARLHELAQAIHERLATCADEAVANRPQSRELTGRSEPMILNGAYLVSDAGAALAAEIELLAVELAAEGVDLEVTGPWPAYNFVESSEDV